MSILLRKKTASNLNMSLSFMIDNAYFACKPPEKIARKQAKMREPWQLYTRQLLYKDLHPSKLDLILSTLKKLNWKDPNVLSFLKKTFAKVDKFQFSRLNLVAHIVNDLGRIYSDFSVFVVDSLLESIRLGLETNLFHFNQLRTSQVVFLGELYNVKLIDHTVIFNTLFLFLSFGHGKVFKFSWNE